MADDQRDPHDDKVTTVPLPSDEADGADRVIAQENQSAEVALGGGEWPSPDAPSTGPSPGPTGSGDAERTGREEPGGFTPIKDVLEDEPVAGGSRSVPGNDGDGHDAGGTRLA